MEASHPVKKENQRVRLTKRLLQENLIGLLMEKSIYQISISELCDAAGINRTTFYRYYGSQFDLLSEMEGDMIGSLQALLTCQESELSVQTLTRICAYLEENISLCRLLINNNIDPNFSTRLFQLEPVQRSLLNSLQNAFRDEELAYVSAFVTDGGFRLLQRWLNKDDREPPEQIALLMTSLVGSLTRA